MSNKTTIEKNLQERSVLVSREFNAPIEDVWRAFTEKEILDQWWAPAPWRAETKHMDFSVGGHWLYAMVSPENEKHWGRMNYLAISLHQSYDLEDFFCDENGKANEAFPMSKGRNVFTQTENGVRVDFKTTYPTEKDLQTIVEMGFEQGISACFDQLQLLFDKKIHA